MCEADCVQAIFDLRSYMQLALYMAEICTACIFGIMVHRFVR